MATTGSTAAATGAIEKLHRKTTERSPAMRRRGTDAFRFMFFVSKIGAPYGVTVRLSGAEAVREPDVPVIVIG